MTTDEAEAILRKYRTSVAYPVAGQPFGYGIVMFKDRFRKKLIARGDDSGVAWNRAERAYERVMRYVPTFAQYCQARAVLQPAPIVAPSFTAPADPSIRTIDLSYGRSESAGDDGSGQTR